MRSLFSSHVNKERDNAGLSNGVCSLAMEVRNHVCLVEVSSSMKHPNGMESTRFLARRIRSKSSAAASTNCARFHRAMQKRGMLLLLLL